MRGIGRRKRPDNLVRMPRRRQRRFFVRSALIVAIVCTCAALVGFFWTVGSIRVVGVESLSPTQVVVESGLQPGDRMFFTNMRAAVLRLKANPQVAAVAIRRRLPNSLLIEVSERLPLFALDSKPELAADRAGRLFAKPVDLKLPALTGWKAVQPKAGGALDTRSVKVLRAYEQFPASLTTKVVSMRLEPGVTLVLDSGTEVRMGAASNLEAKAAAANAVLADSAARKVDLEYIDVRAPRAPVARPVIVQTPEPTANVRKPAPATAKPPTARQPTPRPRPATPRPAVTPKP